MCNLLNHAILSPCCNQNSRGRYLELMKVDANIFHSSPPDISALIDAAVHHFIIFSSSSQSHIPLHLAYAAALNLAALFLTSNLICFLSLITLNLSKSVRFRLVALRARFFAQADSSQVFSTLAASHCFLMAPVPAPWAILGTTMWVRETCARAAEWRGTARAASVESTLR